MGSKAIYSEIVELVLTIDKFESRIKDAMTNIYKVQEAASKPVTLTLDTKAMVLGMVNARSAVAEYKKELEATDRTIQQLLLKQERQATLRRNSSGAVTGFGEYGTSQTVSNAARAAAAYRNEHAAMASILSMEKERTEAIRQQYNYRLGKGVAGTRASDAIGMAAGGSFLLGNTNMGGALYMVERLARHTELGKKSLGELVQSFTGVSVGAEASAASVAAFGTSVSVMAGIVAAVAAPLAAMFAGNKLDNAVANMSTLLADASVSGSKFSDMMNMAANSASRVGESFGIGLVDTVNGFKTALSTGIDASQLEEFGTIAATVTKGLGTTFEDATGILTTFRDSYNLSMGEMREVSDVLFNAINVGKFQVDDLKNNIGRVVTASAEAGVSFKDMSAGLATLTRVGLSTSQSITSMNRFIQNIVSPTDQAKAAFDRLGLATGHAAFKTQTLMQYLRQLKSAVGGNADLMGELFSTEQGRRGAIGLTTNIGLTSSIRTAMDDVGTATIAANRAMDTFSQNFGKVFQTVWDVVQLIGRDLLQVANDVFFPGGPLSADSMVNFKNVLEAVGIAIKEIGIIIIGVAGAVFNGFKLIGTVVAGIGAMLRGDILDGLNMINAATTDFFSGIGNAIAAVFTTIGTSTDRMRANMLGAIPAEEIATRAATAKDAVKSIFGDDVVSAMDSFSTKAVSKYDKLIEAIRKARFEAAKLAWEQENPAKNTRPAMEAYKPSEAERGLLAKISIGHRVRYNESDNWDSEDNIQSRIRKAGGMDPDSEEAKILLDAMSKRIEEHNRKAGEKAGKAFIEGRTKAMQEAMAALGFSDLMPKDEKKAPTATGNVYGANVLQQFEEAGVAIRSLTEGTPLKNNVGWIMELGKQVPIFEEVTDKVRKLELAKRELVDAEQALAEAIAKNELTPEQLAANKNTLEQMRADVKKADADITKEKIKEYEKQFKFERKMYDAKMQMIDAESKKLQALRQNNEDDMKNVVDTLQDIRAKDRPGTARREYKDAAETDIRRASQATTIESMDAFLDSATEMLKKMVDTGDAEDRAKRDQKDLLTEILRMRQEAERKFGNAESSITDQKKAASRQFESNVADNPVAQVAIKEASRIMQEMATEAAKRGISMNGNLVSTVELNVDTNIPLGALRDAVVATVRDEMTRVAQDMLNKKAQTPSNAGNITPPGAP